MRNGKQVGRLCALVGVVLMASVVMAPAAQAASLAIVSGAPPMAFVEGTDFLEMRRSGLGSVTSPVRPVDLMEPGPTASSSTSGCEADDFAGFAAGSIALMQRGTCLFQTKVDNAIAAGSVGAIIFNEGQPGRTGVIGTTLVSDVSIPVVFASYEAGQRLRSNTEVIVAQLMTDGSFDDTPPTLELPAELVVGATSPDGAAVMYSVSATDDFDSDPAVSCTPESGSLFAVGTTTVECSARDTAGNTSTGSFAVVVQGAAEQTSDLIDRIASSSLPRGTKASLSGKLRSAEAAMARGNTGAACNMIDAFKREVSAQSGRMIPTTEAETLLQEADAIKLALGCP